MVLYSCFGGMFVLPGFIPFLQNSVISERQLILVVFLLSKSSVSRSSYITADVSWNRGWRHYSRLGRTCPRPWSWASDLLTNYWGLHATRNCSIANCNGIVLNIYRIFSEHCNVRGFKRTECFILANGRMGSNWDSTLYYVLTCRQGFWQVLPNIEIRDF